MAMMTGLRCPLHILTIPASGSSSPTARMTDGTLAALEFVVVFYGSAANGLCPQ